MKPISFYYAEHVRLQVENERLIEINKAQKDTIEAQQREIETLKLERDAAIEDIHTAYSDGLCEVCGSRETCLMTLDRGEDESTVCHGIKFEYRGRKGQE